MDLSSALTAYDRVALNLDKLDRVWQRMRALVPEGAYIDAGSDDCILYGELAESWMTIAKSLPAIGGWRLEAAIIDYTAIGQTRLDYLELGEQEGLFAFEEQVGAPATEAARYRHKLARARQKLVRQRAAELVQTVDQLLTSVPAQPDQQLPKLDTDQIIATIGEAVDEIERLLGDALAGGPRQSDLHRHLYFGKPHDLRDIATMDWPAFRPHVEIALYSDEDPVPIDVEDLASLSGIPEVPLVTGREPGAGPRRGGDQ
ncbi:hypothetical protein ABZ260_05770 [Streptosporangium sp. NPDC006013]|uniref:hypothetical protein n=1 Tax=Streptosporangium sp. NPDC006013 TaxID=3155596 RepID=UPI0033BAA7E0